MPSPRLVSCIRCGHWISSEADLCPKCHSSQKIEFEPCAGCGNNLLTSKIIEHKTYKGIGSFAYTLRLCERCGSFKSKVSTFSQIQRSRRIEFKCFLCGSANFLPGDFYFKSYKKDFIYFADKNGSIVPIDISECSNCGHRPLLTESRSSLKPSLSLYIGDFYEHNIVPYSADKSHEGYCWACNSSVLKDEGTPNGYFCLDLSSNIKRSNSSKYYPSGLDKVMILLHRSCADIVYPQWRQDWKRVQADFQKEYSESVKALRDLPSHNGYPSNRFVVWLLSVLTAWPPLAIFVALLASEDLSKEGTIEGVLAVSLLISLFASMAVYPLLDRFFKSLQNKKSRVGHQKQVLELRIKRCSQSPAVIDPRVIEGYKVVYCPNLITIRTLSN